ncbi:hypothetical protein CKJ81_07065 [Corynebacterium hadale]|uniref:Uncharacterized protein n=1 Tax=Corynebacterium hadale TaxID=2026255 RepID=A0ABX4HAB7_9CORY|nr:hypothetical protein CKJ81_07065 [Corynebacterium hadale]
MVWPGANPPAAPAPAPAPAPAGPGIAAPPRGAPPAGTAPPPNAPPGCGAICPSPAEAACVAADPPGAFAATCSRTSGFGIPYSATTWAGVAAFPSAERPAAEKASRSVRGNGESSNAAATASGMSGTANPLPGMDPRSGSRRSKTGTTGCSDAVSRGGNTPR